MVFVSCSFLLGWLLGQAQPPLVPTESRDRFAFAQTYVGVGGQYLPGATLASVDGQQALPGMLHPRFQIGGTHFWGLVDFYISIPLGPPRALGAGPPEIEANFNTGVMTGAKIYPWRMRVGGISPFLGANWSFFNLQLDTDEAQGPGLTHHRLAWEAGLSFTSSNWHIWELAGTFTPGTEVEYYLSRTETGRFSWPGWSVSLSYKKLFDTTEGSEPVADLSNRRHLNAWHIGLGPSTTQAVRTAEYVETQTPYLDNPMGWNLFPELSLGYYWHQPDLDFRLTYRPMRARQEAYGVIHQVNRQSLALEAYANLFDYQGFVPFVGLSLAAERYRFRQEGNGVTALDQQANGLVPGLVFGWDIRPNRYKAWLLRTNLRIYPSAGFEVAGRAFSMRQLEFNFIQLVLFPQRLFE